MSIRIPLVLAALTLSIFAHAQSSAIAPCSQIKGQYQCDRAAFVRMLSRAGTIAVETQPFDRNGQRELNELVTHLGKAMATANADLTIRLERLDPESSIYFGPNARALASLRVYSRGTLIWVETYAGQPDTPWPTVVYRTIQQFEAEVKFEGNKATSIQGS